MKKYISILITLAFFNNLVAQPLRAITLETKLSTADAAAQGGDYYNAIDWFGQAFEESKDMNLQVAMADLYAKARDYKKAEQMYLRVLKRDKTKEFEDIRPALASVLKSQSKYNEALEQYALILANAETPDSIKKATTLEKESIEKYDKYSQNLEVGIGYIKGKVNSGSAESAPILGPDGKLYYSSFNARKEVIIDGKEGDYHAKIYSAAQNDKGDFDKAEKLNDLINRQGFHHAGVSFSRDGRKMYFTRAKMTANGIDESRIFYSTAKGNVWGNPTEITDLNGDFINKHPVEGDLFGRQVLFFTSNRPGGLGGFDIYYAEVKGDGFGVPVNLGPSINTAKDEITPFYKDGTLYFSSDGRGGLGGFDIFFAEWNGQTWNGLDNIGFQYNTSYDDLFLRFNDDGKSGFLVSNRPDKSKLRMKGSETCCDDIYMVGIKELVVSLFAEVTDDKGKLNEATLELYDQTLGGYPDTKTNPTSNEFSFPLEVDRRYKAVISKDGYYPDTVSFNTNGIVDDYTVRKAVKLKPRPVTDLKDKTQIVKLNEAIRLNNIYYDLDKWNILPDAEEDLDYLTDLMNKYPQMIIELSSHTDAQGADAYNEKLSQRRSESARTWLINQGINGERIKAVGYGESIILNRCRNGVKCSDDEHRLNRRTEFKIIGGVDKIEIKKEGYDGKASPTEPTFNKPTNPTLRSTSGRQSFSMGAPIITFDDEPVNAGKVKQGQPKEVSFSFTNTGNADLNIEIVTACKCLDITWPKEPVKPGDKGIIKAIFDSSYQPIGKMIKTLDIVSNTEPLLVEARFTVEIEPK
jgi:peptidoglycan-associated lipoprotein